MGHMPSFNASIHALASLVAISQRCDGLRLSELARVFDSSVSAIQRAVGLLQREGLIERIGDMYRINGEHPGSRAAVEFAIAFIEVPRLARALAASRAIEYLGADETDIVIVTRRFPDPIDEVRLRETVASVHRLRRDFDVEVIAHQEVRRRLLVDTDLRARIANLTTVVGNPERAFPSRRRKRAPDPLPLHRLHELVAAPDPASLRRFAREHGLRRIVAFGSAVTTGFEPGSDLDLYVEPVSAIKPGLAGLTAMVSDAEALFQRDVDLVVGPTRSEQLRASIERDGVPLYGGS
jgi:predicted nucleotidyltransferase